MTRALAKDIGVRFIGGTTSAIIDNVEVTTTGGGGGGNDYADWIALYPAVGGQTGLGDDPDGDGDDNGVENFFGTDPGVASTGVIAEAVNRQYLHLYPPAERHPRRRSHRGLPVVDRPRQFLRRRGRERSDHRHLFSATDTPSPGITTVTATIAGDVPLRLFVRVEGHPGALTNLAGNPNEAAAFLGGPLLQGTGANASRNSNLPLAEREGLPSEDGSAEWLPSSLRYDVAGALLAGKGFPLGKRRSSQTLFSGSNLPLYARRPRPCVAEPGSPGGAGGIRTLDTLVRYTPLAGERFRPLSHRSVVCAFALECERREGNHSGLGSSIPRRGEGAEFSFRVPGWNWRRLAG